MNSTLHRISWLESWRVSRERGRPWRTGWIIWATFTLRLIKLLLVPIPTNTPLTKKSSGLNVIVSCRWGLRSTWTWEEPIVALVLSSLLFLLSGFVSAHPLLLIFQKILLQMLLWFCRFYHVNYCDQLNDWSLTCWYSQVQVGLLYDEQSLHGALDIIRDWTNDERRMLRNEVYFLPCSSFETFIDHCWIITV